ncbi:MAG: hypothetical protein KAQ85_00830 [Thermodesulfovibrionia bacterium]|nr:hypothetical protein [Thermodesulfovibrionia bacterium]
MNKREVVMIDALSYVCNAYKIHTNISTIEIVFDLVSKCKETFNTLNEMPDEICHTCKYMSLSECSTDGIFGSVSPTDFCSKWEKKSERT